MGFNPCDNGTYSRTLKVCLVVQFFVRSFNPCDNGTYSRTLFGTAKILLISGFNPCDNGTYSRTLFPTTTAVIESEMFQSL